MRYRAYPQYEWFYDVRRQALILHRYETEDTREPEEKLVLPIDDYEDLKEFMKNDDPFGQFVTDRSDDLKIIHRLLDIQEKMVK